MSHNLESMFYVANNENGEKDERLVPWHGLGTPVAEAPTSADALRLAGLDWQVNQQTIYTNGGIIPGFVANVRSDNNSVLGVVTDRYKVVQNTEAFDFTDSLISDEVRYETAGSLRNGKTIWLLARMPQTTILGDKVDPYLCFTNSHDGTGAIKVCMTPIRVVCNNTLNVALSSAKRSWSTKHIGDIQTKLEEAKMTLGLANSYMNGLAQYADRMANSSITDEEIFKYLDELFPLGKDASDRQKKNVEQAKQEIIVCYLAPDIAKFRGTKYGFVNAVADWVGHATPARVTKDYQSNNWGRIIDGHPVFDKACELVGATA